MLTDSVKTSSFSVPPTLLRFGNWFPQLFARLNPLPDLGVVPSVDGCGEDVCMICASAGTEALGVGAFDPLREYRPHISDPGSTCALLLMNSASRPGEDSGEELRARFRALVLVLPGFEHITSHSIRSSGEISCTARLTSPIPIRSVSASLPAGVDGTSFLAGSGKFGCDDLLPPSCTATRDLVYPTAAFSLSSSDIGLTIGCFAIGSGLDCPPN